MLLISAFAMIQYTSCSLLCMHFFHHNKTTCKIPTIPQFSVPPFQPTIQNEFWDYILLYLPSVCSDIRKRVFIVGFHGGDAVVFQGMDALSCSVMMQSVRCRFAKNIPQFRNNWSKWTRQMFVVSKLPLWVQWGPYRLIKTTCELYNMSVGKNYYSTLSKNKSRNDNYFLDENKE